jgi:hypothetical protein
MQEGSLCLQSFAGDTEDGKSTLKKEEKEQKLDNFFFKEVIKVCLSFSNGNRSSLPRSSVVLGKSKCILQ